jgi:hypothetical protein
MAAVNRSPRRVLSEALTGCLSPHNEIRHAAELRIDELAVMPGN